MNGFWNATSKQGFNVTQEQYNMLYDTATTGSMGETIKQMYALAAKTFSCADATKCTTEELFAK